MVATYCRGESTERAMDWTIKEKKRSTFFSSFLNLHPLRVVFSYRNYDEVTLSQNFSQWMFRLQDPHLTVVWILARWKTLIKITVSSSLYKFVKNSAKLPKDSCSDLWQSHYIFLLASVADLENKTEAFPPMLLISLLPVMKLCRGRSLLTVEKLDLRN